MGGDPAAGADLSPPPPAPPTPRAGEDKTSGSAKASRQDEQFPNDDLKIQGETTPKNRIFVENKATIPASAASPTRLQNGHHSTEKVRLF